MSSFSKLIIKSLSNVQFCDDRNVKSSVSKVKLSTESFSVTNILPLCEILEDFKMLTSLNVLEKSKSLIVAGDSTEFCEMFKL